MQIAPRPNKQSNLKPALIGVITTLLLAWLLLHSPVLAPTIKITTVDFPTEKSQLFFKEKTPYSEKDSFISQINKNDQSFEFTLPFYVKDVRWDPLEAAGEFSIKSVQISVFGFNTELDIGDTTPLNQINKTSKNGLTHFVAPTDSSDPQIKIHLNHTHTKIIRIAISLTLSFITTIILVSCRKSIINFIIDKQRQLKKPKATMKEKNTKTLGSMVEQRSNNFDLIRLAAALTVLVSHSFPLSGTPTSSSSWYSLFLGYEPSSLSVYAFFSISGFLIAGSLERRSLLEYWQARALRILPALAVTSFVTTLLIGPIFTTFSMSEYFFSPETYNYLKNSIPYRTIFTLPGVFTDLPLAQSVNGSLWTIPIEAFCYVALAVIFIAGARSFKLALPAILAISSYLTWNSFYGSNTPKIIFGAFELLPTLRFGLIFLVGTALWTYKDIIPFKGGIAASCFAILLLGSRFGQYNLALFIALPYLLFYLAYRRPVFQSAIRKLGDLSYGTYLFAFPIQQSLVSLTDKTINVWVLAITTAAISLGLAWISWRFIEKPAIKIKNRFRATNTSEQPV